MQNPDNLRLSLLETFVANTCGIVKYISYQTMGEPTPDLQDELDGVAIDETYFINLCTQKVLNRKYARRAAREAKKLEVQRKQHSNYYREIN